jgi:catechol 2,3-dioxygenase-like lactoylglutathione lyase family enzyme
MSPATAVTGVDFVTVWTKDLAAASQFYGGILGLRCIERYERIPGAEYETGNLTLQLLEPAAIGREFSPSSPIALHVDDVAATRAELEARGVTFLQAFDSGVCHQAVFEDPTATRSSCTTATRPAPAPGRETGR